MATTQQAWLNVNGASVWPTSSFNATVKNEKAFFTPASTQQQWSTSWAAPVQNIQKVQPPITKEKKKQVVEQVEAVVESLQNLTFVNSDSKDAWAPQLPVETGKSELKKKKKQQEKIQIEEELAKQNLYKTELCRSWIETGQCRYGHKCQFAHGEHELRPVLRHPKYKTEICKTFSLTGHCPYGNRCRFVHMMPGGKTAETSEKPGESPVPEGNKTSIKVPMHTPVVITVGNVPAVINSSNASHATLVDPNQSDDSSSDEESASRKSRLAFFQNLTPADQ